MKELLQQLSSHNVWANRKLTDAALSLREEQLHKELPGSFPSVYQTVLHMYSAENIWWQRLKLQERTVFAADTYKGSFSELTQALLQQSQLWESWVRGAAQHQLEHVFAYRNTKKQEFKQPVYQVLAHVFNHGSYHRGQIVSQLRQLGVTVIPATDFIVWSRK